MAPHHIVHFLKPTFWEKVDTSVKSIEIVAILVSVGVRSPTGFPFSTYIPTYFELEKFF